METGHDLRKLPLRSPVTAHVSYHVDVAWPERHMARITVTLTGAAALGDILTLEMAAWCPGSYLIRDYARHVQNLRAEDADTGRDLDVAKVAKAQWAITRGDAATVRIDYELYGHELSVRTNHIDASHAFLHAPATFAFFPALRDLPVRVTAAGPAAKEWPVVTALVPDGDGYVAATIDELFDSPIHLGKVITRELAAAGKPITLAVWGEPAPGPFSLDDLTRDLERVATTHAARFGGVPYDRYTFILMLSPDSGGGLEHRASSANLASPMAFSSRGEYEDLLELLSHEYFHLWNGKRITPEPFVRPDFAAESYTRCLWVVEGLTAYFDRLTVLRAGCTTARRYLDALVTDWARLLRTPGRFVHDLEQASFDAWIKLYKPDESNINTTVSYYLKGSLVACVLDLEIRARSGGERSLDSILAHMWDRYGRPGRGYPEDVQADFEAACGLDLSAIFAHHIRGTVDPALDAALAHAGLTVRGVIREDPPTWLGIQLSDNLSVGHVLTDSPAETAGISPGDELCALDGYRMRTEPHVRRFLAGRRPGDEVSVALFRRGRLVTVDRVVLGEPGPARFEIASVAEPTDAQRALFAAWLGDDHPGAGFAVSADATSNV